MSTFLKHIYTSILQTNEWKALAPHVTDMEETELLQTYETLQSTSFAQQFHKSLRSIFETQFIQHLKDLPISTTTTEASTSKKSFRQQYLHQAIVHFTHHLPPRFYLPVFRRHLSCLDPLRPTLWECVLLSNAVQPVVQFSSSDSVQSQLYAVCRPYFSRFLELYSLDLDPHLHWSMYFPITCHVRVALPYTVPTAAIASLTYVFSYLFQPSPTALEQVARCVYLMVQKYQEILANEARRTHLLKYTLSDPSDSLLQTWETMVLHFFVGVVAWDVLLSILDWLVLAYDPIESWIDLMDVLLDCQLDQPQARSHFHRATLLRLLCPITTTSSTPTWLTLPIDPTEGYEQLANQVALTPLRLHQLMQCWRKRAFQVAWWCIYVKRKRQGYMHGSSSVSVETYGVTELVRLVCRRTLHG